MWFGRAVGLYVSESVYSAYYYYSSHSCLRPSKHHEKQAKMILIQERLGNQPKQHPSGFARMQKFEPETYFEARLNVTCLLNFFLPSINKVSGTG